MKKTDLNGIYNTYNKRRFVHPDPLEFLDCYNDIRDREIAALIASSPKDPLKYDFVITRFGIRGDMDMASLFAGKQ